MNYARDSVRDAVVPVEREKKRENFLALGFLLTVASHAAAHCDLHREIGAIAERVLVAGTRTSILTARAQQTLPTMSHCVSYRLVDEWIKTATFFLPLSLSISTRV